MSEEALSIKADIQSLIRQADELDQLIHKRKKDYAFAVQRVERVRAKDIKEGDEIVYRTNGNERYTHIVGRVYVKKNGMILFIRKREGLDVENPSPSDSYYHILHCAAEPMKWIEVLRSPTFAEDEFFHEVATSYRHYSR